MACSLTFAKIWILQTGSITIKQFYKDIFNDCCPELDKFFEDEHNKDIGHFNVFDIESLYTNCNSKPAMPYNRRNYYKVSLIHGKNRVEYADKIIEIDGYAVLFASPKIPYNYTPLDTKQKGHFCVFTADFITKSNSGWVLDDMPIFKASTDFIFELSAAQAKDVKQIFAKMHTEIGSDYTYKYDLLRNYLVELIHFGQKLKPMQAASHSLNAATRISTLFIELLERQFPVESVRRILSLRTAKDYADTLQVHVNHLNKVLKEQTGKTTTEIISGRIAEEAKILLKQTTWNISEIANSLGFEEVAHFSNFFKKQTGRSPLAFRELIFEIYK